MPKTHTFQRFAEVAASASAAAGTPRRPRKAEADPRFHPWWQVRSLISASRILLLTVPAALLGAAPFIGQNPFDAPDGSPGSIAVFAVIVIAYVGGHVGPVRRLHRAATSLQLDEVRYVLLLDPQRKYAPAMVLFPLGGGPEAPPIGIIPLRPPVRGGLAGIAPGLTFGFRSKERAAADLPTPVGTAQLHGGVPGAPRIVVPWVDGQPLWPAAAMVTERPGRPHFLPHHLDRLLLGTRPWNTPLTA